ncbi:Pol, partial [Symbiodinium necroappetens]
MGCNTSKTGAAVAAPTPVKDPVPVVASESKASTEAPGAEELTEEVASQVKKAAQTIEADVAQVVGEAAETIQVQAGAKDQPYIVEGGYDSGSRLSMELFLELQVWLKAKPEVGIFMLQETHWSLQGEWTSGDWYILHSAATKPKQGGLLLGIRKDLLAGDHHSWNEIVPGRLLHWRGHLGKQQVDLFNLYQHSLSYHNDDQKKTVMGHRKTLWQHLDKAIAALPFRTSIILMGDFNMVMQPHTKVAGFGIHSGNNVMDLRQERAEVMEMLERHRLTALNTWGRKTYTYKHPSGNSQIDYVVIRQQHADHGSKGCTTIQAPVAGWRTSGHEILQDVPQYAYRAQASTADPLLRASQHCQQVRKMLDGCLDDRTSRLLQQKQPLLLGGMMVSLDLSKAFDSLTHEEMYLALTDTGMPTNLANVLVRIHIETKLHIVHKGHQQTVGMGRGLRQGCGVAPMIYAAWTCRLCKQLTQELGQGWPQQHVSIYADDKHGFWQLRCPADLDKARRELGRLIHIITRLGMTVNSSKSRIVIALKGKLHLKKMHQITKQWNGQQCLMIPYEGSTLYIPVHSTLEYLGMRLGYGKFEVQAAQHRVQQAHVAFNQLKVLQRAGIDVYADLSKRMEAQLRALKMDTARSSHLQCNELQRAENFRVQCVESTSALNWAFNSMFISDIKTLNSRLITFARILVSAPERYAYVQPAAPKQDKSNPQYKTYVAPIVHPLWTLQDLTRLPINRSYIIRGRARCTSYVFTTNSSFPLLCTSFFSAMTELESAPSAMEEDAVSKFEDDMFKSYFPAGIEAASTAPSSESGIGEGREHKAAKIGAGQKGQNRGKGSQKEDDSWAGWGRSKRSFGDSWQQSSWEGHDSQDRRSRADLMEEIKELKSSMFQLQRLALRHEDYLGALRPETSYAIFCRIGVPASIVPAVFKAQQAWREQKETDPESLDKPMRVNLLTCVFREFSARLQNFGKQERTQDSMKKLGWISDAPMKWNYLKWDPKAERLKQDTKREGISFEQGVAVVESILVLVQKTGPVTRFHPSRTVEEEMRGSNVTFSMQLALYGEEAHQLRQHMATLTGSSITQLMAMAW